MADQGKVAVLGLGYVGLPVLNAVHKAGFAAVGFDKSQDRVDYLRASISLDGTTLGSDPAILGGSKTFVICVPTPLDLQGQPDYTYVVDAARTVGQHLSKGSLVILESTVAPGTTSGLFAKVLNAESGLKAGLDFALAFSPERVDPANTSHILETTPKLVGGLTTKCSQRALGFYAGFVKRVVLANSCEEAEAAKLLENTYRLVNVALINEFSEMTTKAGINILNVIDLASTKPFGFQPFYPSLGAGGHCIPVDPVFLIEFGKTLGFESTFLQIARDLNTSRPSQLGSQLMNRIASQARGGYPEVLLLGLTYKANVGDFRESRQLDLAHYLTSRGVNVRVHDPFLSEESLSGLNVVEEKDFNEALRACDFIVLAQAHDEYLAIDIQEIGEKLINLSGRKIPGVRWGV